MNSKKRRDCCHAVIVVVMLMAVSTCATQGQQYKSQQQSQQSQQFSDQQVQSQNMARQQQAAAQQGASQQSANISMAQGGANGNYAGNSNGNIGGSQSAGIPLNNSTSAIAENQVMASANNAPLAPQSLLTPGQAQNSPDVAAEAAGIPDVAPMNASGSQASVASTPAQPALTGARGVLTWIGYDYRKLDKLLDLRLVTSGQPGWRMFKEFNRAGQTELVIRFDRTSLRHRVRRDLNATEFRSPVGYVRVRGDQISDSTDVILTMRDAIEPTVKSTRSGVTLTFAIPDRWLSPSENAQPVASAEISTNETPGMTGVDDSRRDAPSSPIVPKSDEVRPASDQRMLKNDRVPFYIEDTYMVSGVAQANFSADIPPASPESAFDDEIPETNMAMPLSQGPNETQAVSGSELVGVSAGVSPTATISSKKAIRLDFRDAPVSQVIRMIANESGINFIISPEAGTKKTSISLKNVPWDVALRAVLESNRLGMQEIAPGLVRIDYLKVFSDDKDAEERARQSTEALVPTKVLVMPLNYAKAEDAAKIAAAMLPKVTDPQNVAQKRNFERFKAQADTRSNAVIVEATPNVLATIKALLERLDAQTPQVRIASRLVEVTNDIFDGLGVAWGAPLNMDPGRGLSFGSLPFPNNMTSQFSVDPGGGTNYPGGSAAVKFGSLNNMIALDLKLKFYETKRKAETLQTQDVVVQDNEKALVSAGSTDFFQTTAGIGGAGTLTPIDYNLSMSVTPHITADGAVQMKLEIKGDSPKASSSAAASKSTRQLQTTLLKRSGETAVIGGLYSSEVSKTHRGVPYLSSIPLIGALFRSTDTIDSKKDLLIMVTPTIVGAATASSNGAADAGFQAPVVANNAAINAVNGQNSAASQNQQSSQNLAPGNQAQSQVTEPLNTSLQGNAQ